MSKSIKPLISNINLSTPPIQESEDEEPEDDSEDFYPTAFIGYPTAMKAVPSPTRAFCMEFFGVFILMFLGTLVTVELNTIPVFVRTESISQYSVANETNGAITWITVPDSTQFLNNANGMQVTTDSVTFFRNPAGLFTIAVMWGSLFFLVIRALPGVALIPWVSLYNLVGCFMNIGEADKYVIKYENTGEVRPRSYGEVSQQISDYRKKSIPSTLSAIAGQFLGGFIGIVCVYLTQNRNIDKIGETVPTTRVSNDADIIAYEFIAAFIFASMLNYFSPPRRITPVQQAGYISFAVFVLYMAFGDFTGCGLSWVRTFAPALMRAMAGHGWRANTLYYLIGQVLGFSSVLVIVKILNLCQRK